MNKLTDVPTKRQTMKRILVLLTLAIAGMITGVSAAQAEVVTNETVSSPYAYVGFVSCANGGAGEYMTGTIDVHNLITSTVNGNVDTWQFQFQPHGSLVGRITGDTYQLTGLTRGTYTDSLQDDHRTLTYVSSYQLIGPGPDNNLIVREIAHITINDDDQVVIDHDDWSVECN
jgi:hypothetical protein